jgi:N6-L-threonylcarbamoyladenine synthase
MVPAFPALCLIVSGGHTELVLMRGFGEYERLGETQDDAVGEAFDKVAKMLKLPYPGGPQVSKRAEKGNAKRFAFPRPMMTAPNFDFSYSGLKTAVRVTVEDLRKKGIDVLEDEQTLNDVCASFQAAALEPLIAKSERALRVFQDGEGILSLILAGGVSANTHLRAEMAQLAATYQIPIFMPDLQLTGDNAAMIAATGYFRAQEASEANIMNLQADSGWRLGA